MPRIAGSWMPVHVLHRIKLMVATRFPRGSPPNLLQNPSAQGALALNVPEHVRWEMHSQMSTSVLIPWHLLDTDRLPSLCSLPQAPAQARIQRMYCHCQGRASGWCCQVAKRLALPTQDS